MTDRNSYALGMSIAHNMVSSGIREIEWEDFSAGLKAVLTGQKPEIGFDEASALLDKYFNDLEQKQKEEQTKAGAAARKEGEDFLAANSLKPEVVTLKSGLQYRVIRAGSGRRPTATSRVQCHYEGKFISGKKFDSSYDRGEPAVFGLNQVIRGWTEGLQLMSEGAEYEFFIPYSLGYGERGAQGAIPPYSALIFRVELLKVL
ncbi:MAG: FKBP-type peptidyl-prolyl cis-trans isomerase [Bacteroidales bacterium]|nr:FKBP-type peptidyl-prolyl cis-trans isomerase [Bacteroidales bacterium]